jgi:hypothetical protein
MKKTKIPVSSEGLSPRSEEILVSSDLSSVRGIQEDPDALEEPERYYTGFNYLIT